MSLLTRDQILTADDLPFEDVPVPEWGGTVRVRTMTGTERDEYETKVSGGGEGKRDISNIRAGFVAKVIVDEEGQRVFSAGDVAKLGLKSAKALDRVFEVAARLSGISEDDEKKLAQDAADEDFGDAQGERSTSD